jgi:hypothetical protein
MSESFVKNRLQAFLQLKHEVFRNDLMSFKHLYVNVPDKRKIIIKPRNTRRPDLIYILVLVPLWNARAISTKI